MRHQANDIHDDSNNEYACVRNAWFRYVMLVISRFAAAASITLRRSLVWHRCSEAHTASIFKVEANGCKLTHEIGSVKRQIVPCSCNPEDKGSFLLRNLQRY